MVVVPPPSLDHNLRRAVHLTHAASAERFKDFVMSEGLADHGGCPFRGNAESAYSESLDSINGS